MELPGGLLEDLKNYLDITWEDDDGDKKLLGIAERGIKYLEDAAGGSLDFSVEDKPRELLFDYCRYVRANALHEFQSNYLPELLTLQIGKEVGRYGAGENADLQQRGSDDL